MAAARSSLATAESPDAISAALAGSLARATPPPKRPATRSAERTEFLMNATRRSVPAQEQQFGAEPRTEGGQQPVRAGWRRPPGEPLVEHEQYGGAGLVSVLAQHVPRARRVRLAEPQLLLHVRQQLLPARVQDERAELLASHAGAGEEAVQEATHLGADQLRHVAREHDVEPVAPQVEAHRAKRVREQVALEIGRAHV